eukprot:g1945.t1
MGGLLEPDGRKAFHAKLCEVMEQAGHGQYAPPCREGETIFEFVPDPGDRSRPWKHWAPADAGHPRACPPTTRSPSDLADPELRRLRMVGAAGTAKTSTAKMFLNKYPVDVMLSKRLNFSSATTPLGLQKAIEGEVERKTGKTFCPPGGKPLTVFLDDASMPLVNKWEDQVTNELTRQLMEFGGFYFLDRDKRGEFKRIEHLTYIAAMMHPGGGRNDIPNRLKSKFFLFNMVLPSTVSADNIYGSILRARFNTKLGVDGGVVALSANLTTATIALWTKVQKVLLPTPARPDQGLRYLARFNEKNPAKNMNLVLFEDALMHLMRINRTIQQKRGSAMLVGVGGSGKQSLTRLAAFISGHHIFQITITKTYGEVQFLEDLKELFIIAGQKDEDVTFIFTDQDARSDVINENFLEIMNSILATGEVVGLLQKDEKEAVCNEVRNDFASDYPGQEENTTNLYNYFLNRLRDNLHIVLFFSPLHHKFAIRAQMFPAVFSGVNINWFLPWPEEALVAVSANFLKNFKIDTTEENRNRLYELMASFQNRISDVSKAVLSCPPGRYYKKLYASKYEDVNVQEKSVNIGLRKLEEAAKSVLDMQDDIERQDGLEMRSEDTWSWRWGMLAAGAGATKGPQRAHEKVLKMETDKVTALVKKVHGEKQNAEEKAEEVGSIAKTCEDNAMAIDADRQDARAGAELRLNRRKTLE